MEATPYVKQVIEEAMRLYPPVGMLARNVRRADSLGGREILPNDVLFLQSMHCIGIRCGGSARMSLTRTGFHRRPCALATAIFIFLLVRGRAFASARTLR